MHEVLGGLLLTACSPPKIGIEYVPRLCREDLGDDDETPKPLVPIGGNFTTPLFTPLQRLGPRHSTLSHSLPPYLPRKRIPRKALPHLNPVRDTASGRYGCTGSDGWDHNVPREAVPDALRSAHAQQPLPGAVGYRVSHGGHRDRAVSTPLNVQLVTHHALYKPLLMYVSVCCSISSVDRAPISLKKKNYK